MRVVSLSLDPKLLEPESAAAMRAKAYGAKVDHYTIIVPLAAATKMQLSNSVTVIATGGTWKPVRLYRLARSAAAILRTRDVSVITSQDTYYLGLVASVLARVYGVGFEVQVHGLEKFGTVRRLLTQYVLTRADMVRVVSARLQHRLVQEFKVDLERIAVIPVYVAVETLGASSAIEKAIEVLRPEFKNRFNFLTVSRLVPEKNISLQLEAIAVLKETRPDVHLHIVGEGKERACLQERVTALDIESYVTFHGWQEKHNLAAFYTLADCFLLTSHSEGWGMVIIEAAHAGLPVIMTDVGCAGEFIINNKQGLIVPGESTALTTAMEHVYDTPALRARFSRALQEVVQQLPSYEAVVDRCVNNWELAASRHNSRRN